MRYRVISSSKKRTFFPKTNSMLCFIITKQWMGPVTLMGFSGMKYHFSHGWLTSLMCSMHSHQRESYKKALPRRDALKLMRNEIFPSFDEELLNTFAAFIEEPDSSGSASENRIKAVLGTPISLQCEPLGTKMKSKLIGMEPDRFIIFSLSNPVQFAKLRIGMPLIARYLYDGEAFGFKETILSTVHDPPLVLTTYPGKNSKH